MKVTDEQWEEVLETNAFAESLAVWIEVRRERLSKTNPDRSVSSLQSDPTNNSLIESNEAPGEAAALATESTSPAKSGRVALTALRAALAKHYGIELSDEELSHVIEQTWARIGKPTRAVQ